MATVRPHGRRRHAAADPAAAAVARRRSSASGMLAMVFFIGSEVMLFGSLFTAYFFVRFNIADTVAAAEPGRRAVRAAEVITAVNTAILVGSSFTVYWARAPAHTQRPQGPRARPGW